MKRIIALLLFIASVAQAQQIITEASAAQMAGGTNSSTFVSPRRLGPLPGPVGSATAGGTGQTIYAAGDILYASSSTTLSKLGIGTTGKPLVVSAGFPSWQTLPESGGGTGHTSYATGDLLYASSATVLSRLAVGSNTNVLTLAGGVPTWAAPAASYLTTLTASNGLTVTVGTGTLAGTITIGSPITFAGSGTLTLPTSGTVGLLGTAQSWTAGNTFATVTISNNVTPGSTAPLYIVNTNSASGVNLITALASNAVATNEVYISFGVASSNYNSTGIGFKYAGAGSTSNLIGFGFYGTADFLTLNGLGVLKTTAGNASSSTISGDGVFAGGVGVGGAVNSASITTFDGSNTAYVGVTASNSSNGNAAYSIVRASSTGGTLDLKMPGNGDLGSTNAPGLYGSASLMDINVAGTMIVEISTATSSTAFRNGHTVYANGFSTSGSMTTVGISPFTAGAGVAITGTTTTSNAASGVVGEVISSAVATGSAVSLASTTTTNATSITLTAGDWDVSGNVNFNAGSATVTAMSAGITQTSATVPSDGTEGYSGALLTVTSAVDTITLPRKRISLSSSQTVYLVGRATFSAGTDAIFGSIAARRPR